MRDAKVCGICGDADEPTPVVECIECLLAFHLTMRKDRPGKDCGDAILGESMGVEMICNNCIDLRRTGDDPSGNLLGMYAAMTGGMLPAPVPPAAGPAPLRPPRPASKPADGERQRRRFRRIDR